MIGDLSLDKREGNCLISVLWGKSSRLQSTKQLTLSAAWYNHRERTVIDTEWAILSAGVQIILRKRQTRLRYTFCDTAVTLELIYSNYSLQYFSYLNVCFKLTVLSHPSLDSLVQTELNMPKLIYSSNLKTCCLISLKKRFL